MTENINNLTSTEISSQVEKIKTHFAQIIVGGNRRMPYYHILFFNPADGEFHAGWSSYKLKYVRRWLRDNFEIVDGGSVFDMSPVKRGRWEEGEKNRFWGTKGNYVCSNCKSAVGFVKFNYCPNCGAKMDGEKCGED